MIITDAEINELGCKIAKELEDKTGQMLGILLLISNGKGIKVTSNFADNGVAIASRYVLEMTTNSNQQLRVSKH